MEKRVIKNFVLFAVVSFVLLSVVSAGFFDMFKKKDVQLSASDGILLKLDFEDGNANDKSGLNIPVTISGATFGTEPGKGKVVKFDGVDDFLKVNSLTGLAERSFTFSFWMKSDYNHDDTNVISKQPAWIYYDAASTNMDVYFYEHGTSKRSAFTMLRGADAVAASYLVSYKANEWQHVAGVYDSVNHKLNFYIDGALADSKDGIGNLGASGAIYIGKSPFGNNFKGSMDDVVIYNKALSQEEIVGLIKSGLGAGSCYFVDSYLVYLASNNNVMTVKNAFTKSKYDEGKILCYNSKFYEASPKNDDWAGFIESANVVNTCIQVGAWYVPSGSETWTRGTVPAGCSGSGGEYVLTCTNIDFNCDTRVTIDDYTKFTLLVSSLSSNSQDLSQARVDTEKTACPKFGDYLQTLLGKELFPELSKVQNKVNECLSDTCPAGKVFKCSDGYTSIESVNTAEGRGSFSLPNCAGDEYILNEQDGSARLIMQKPYRATPTTLCRSTTESNSPEYKSQRSGASCNDFAGTLDEDSPYKIVNGQCVDPPSKVPPCGKYGDVDNDGDVDGTDIGLMTLTNSPTSEQKVRQDVNDDGKIDTADFLLITDFAGGEITTFPVCSDNCPVEKYDYNCDEKVSIEDANAIGDLWKDDTELTAALAYSLYNDIDGCKPLSLYITKKLNEGKTKVTDFDVLDVVGELESCGENRCLLIPDAGNGKAIIPRYYFDSTTQKCTAFNWGGVGGIVPFETLSSCQKSCEVVTTPVCTDSDGGLSYFEKGKVIDYLNDEYGDFCTEDVLTEYICKDNQKDSMTFTCPHGCSNGACLPPPDRGGRAVCIHDLGVEGKIEVDPRVRVDLIRPVGLNYCDPRDLEFKPVIANGDSCLNDYECSSNACIDGECISLRLELQKQTNLLTKILCRIRSVFTSESYDSCLTAEGGIKEPAEGDDTDTDEDDDQDDDTVTETIQLSCAAVDFNCDQAISSADAQILSTAYGGLPEGKVITPQYAYNAYQQCTHLGTYAGELQRRYGRFPVEELNSASAIVTECTPGTA